MARESRTLARMTPPRVLVTDDVHDLLPDGLRELGYHVDEEPNISLAEVRACIGDYRGLVINSKILVDRDLLDAAPQLRWVGRVGSGMEIVDRAYAKTRNVAVISSPEGNAWAVAEHATGMLLGLLNKLRLADQQVRAFAWDREAMRGRELRALTVGIIGFGHTGPAFAKTLCGFGCKILAWDKYRDDFTAETPWVQAAGSAEEVLAKADVLSLHLPLTPETIGYLGASELTRLRPGAIVINTSRGAAIDLAALVDALERRQLGGACLDVFPNEKPKTYSTSDAALMQRLAALHGVVLSPHVAGWTVESKKALAALVLQRVQALGED